MTNRHLFSLLACLLSGVLVGAVGLSPEVHAQSTGTVRAEQKISDTDGGFATALGDFDFFGREVTGIGDVDGDGVPDVVVGADGDDDGGSNRGAVYVLFLASDGTVQSEQKISDTEGGLAATLEDGDTFGSDVGRVGDLDGDGVPDVVVGADGDGDGGSNRGAVYVLFLASDGTVQSEQKISDTEGGLAATLADDDGFGGSVGGIGDVGEGGGPHIIVGANGDDDGGSNRGAAHVLFLAADGTVQSEQKISDTEGGLAATLADDDGFGSSVGGIGDVDGDGVLDVVVGADGDDDGGSNRGAVYVLFLASDGTVQSEQKISDTDGGLAAALDDDDVFGGSVAGIGNVDEDGSPDILVGADRDDDGGSSRGAAYVLFLASDGTVESEQKISDTEGGFAAELGDFDRFGSGVGGIGDVDGDGVTEVIVGAYEDGDGGMARGAAYVLTLNSILPTVFVDADNSSGIQDGTSWSNAYPSLQDGLRRAGANSEVWVAAGTYLPDEGVGIPDNKRDTSFVVTGEKDGLAIYGGFDGTEDNLSSRDPEANEVILSGDIDGNDDPFEPTVDSDSDSNTPTQTDHINGDNSYHVVVLNGGDDAEFAQDISENVTAATVLDGVTVTGGKAVASSGNNVGAGLYCDGGRNGNECSPTLQTVVFEGNKARFGGGAAYFNGFSGGTSNPQLTDATFTGNSAGQQGGAVYNQGRFGQSSAQIENATFANNSAVSFGGAIYNSGIEGISSPVITNTTFTGNSATEGGAIYSDARGGTSNAQIESSVFTDNTARLFGGAIYNEGTNGGTSSPTIIDGTFEGNTATGISGTSGGSGGAIYNEAGIEFSGTTPGTSSPTITGSVFRDNEARSEDNSEGSGGAIYNSARTGTTSPGITNTSFVGNGADNGGGAIQSDARNGGASSPRLTNVLFVGNSAGTNGGALYNLAGEDGGGDSGTSSPILLNVTFAGNTAAADGGAIINDIISGEAGMAQAEITNTIFYGNSAGNGGPQIYNRESGAVPRLGYTLVENGSGGVTNASGASTVYEATDGSGAGSFGASTNIDAPPQFVGGTSLAGADGTLGTADDSLQVTDGSPVLDAGTNAALDTTGDGTRDITTDLTGGPRVRSNDPDAAATTVDLGAYEAPSGTLLPVELAGFEAAATEGGVTLTWRTASETGNAGFEVQRKRGMAGDSGTPDASTEDGTWRAVGSVEGAGTTSRAQSYRFEDTGLPYEADSLMYRLKQVDTDGTASYSEAVTVSRGAARELRLLGPYPNPAQSRATVRFAVPEGPGQGVTLRLYDVLGRRVRAVRVEATAGRHERQLDTRGLAGGVYFLRLRAGGVTKTQKLTVVQ